MDTRIAPFIERVEALSLQHPLTDWPAELRMRSSGDWATYYAPFDYVNPNARIVIVGITPGLQQAGNALAAFQRARGAGHTVDAALAAAKTFASFSGPMRSNLVAMLDHIGLPRVLQIDSCARLFSDRTDFAHFTSVLRYPVTVQEKNYSGTPGILANAFARTEFQDWFVPEVAQLPQAIFVPLGPAVTQAMESLIPSGQLPAQRMLAGLPHPSGANAERIAYFLGRKARADLSKKVDPDKLDAARARLFTQIAAL